MAFVCVDGCNRCWCSNGQIASTLIVCALDGPEGGAAEAEAGQDAKPQMLDSPIRASRRLNHEALG